MHVSCVDLCSECVTRPAEEITDSSQTLTTSRGAHTHIHTQSPRPNVGLVPAAQAWCYKWKLLFYSVLCFCGSAATDINAAAQSQIVVHILIDAVLLNLQTVVFELF